MIVTETALAGVRVIEPRVFPEGRGWSLEGWNAARYAAAGFPSTFAQDNVSYSVAGVVRGLHFQHPTDQGKLVSVLEGEIYDVIVDVRPDSPTFRRWVGVSLSSEDHRQVWIPEGYAHGFASRKPSVVTYKVTSPYDPGAAHIVLWNDEDLAIDWGVHDPILSPKDASALRLRDMPREVLPRLRTE